MPAHLFTAWHDKKVEGQYYVDDKELPEMAPNDAALIPTAQATAGEQSSTSRMYLGEPQL